MIIRFDHKLYAVGGECTFKDSLNECEGNKALKDAICFNDKLMCPHHGCAYDIKTGTVEYGPAYDNLPIFAVKESKGKVHLFYP